MCNLTKLSGKVKVSAGRGSVFSRLTGYHYHLFSFRASDVFVVFPLSGVVQKLPYT